MQRCRVKVPDLGARAWERMTSKKEAYDCNERTKLITRVDETIDRLDYSVIFLWSLDDFELLTVQL